MTTRRAGVEPTRFDRLDLEVQDLRSVVTKVATQVDIISTQVGTLASRTEQKGMNWGWFSSAVGVALAIGSLAFSPIMKDVGRNRDSLDRHAELDGHPVSMRLHTQAEQRFETAEREREAIEANVEENRHELDAIRGDRFSKSDWNRVQDTIIEPISRELDDIQRTRYRGNELQLLDRVSKLEQALETLLSERVKDGL